MEEQKRVRKNKGSDKKAVQGKGLDVGYGIPSAKLQAQYPTTFPDICVGDHHATEEELRKIGFHIP